MEPSMLADNILTVAIAVAVVLLSVVLLMLRKGSAQTAAPAKKPESKAESFPRGPLLILWGSQTGTAESFGNTLMREARQRGFKARSVDLEDYEPDELADEDAPTIFLMSTHGEGEPTDNALPFFKYFNDTDARSPTELESLKFSVFALGNRQYEHFCYMGRWMDSKAEAMGATRIYDLGEGDDDDDLHADFEQWREGLWEALCPGGAEVTSAPAPQFECRLLDGGSAPPTLSFLSSSLPKQRLLECAVAVNRELAQQPEYGSVRHIELRTASVGGSRAALKYDTADDLAVCCDNGEALAARVAKRLGMKPQQRFALRAIQPGGGAAAPLPTPCSVEQALRHYADLRAPVSKALLLLLAEACADPAEAARLSALAAPEGKQEYSEYVLRDGRGLAELLDEFPSSRPAWASLLELVPKLSARYYTISSSPEADAATVHLTVKVLREPMRSAPGRTKEGVCSTQLGALAPGDTAVVFARASGFRLPKDPATPVVMVGPGTGIAPFRAFLQQLGVAANGARRTGHVRLYFGCRRAGEDYLYKEELEGYLQAGTLSSLRLAFSRAQADKVYVQHLVRDDGAELWPLLDKGAHVYICGGTAMGRDVVEALQQTVATHGKMADDAAVKYVKELQAQGRLVQELWS